MKNILILLLLFSSACVTSREPQRTDDHLTLESGKWSAIELYGKPVKLAEGGKTPFINFSKDDHAVNGSGGCNSMFGKFTIHDDLLNFNALAQTEMACMDSVVNAQEFLFFKALNETERYKIHGRLLIGTKKEVLELYKGKSLLAVLELDSL